MFRIIAFSSSSPCLITHTPTRNNFQHDVCLLNQLLHSGQVSILIFFEGPLIMPLPWHTCQLASKMFRGFLLRLQLFSSPWSLLLILPDCPTLRASSPRDGAQTSLLPVCIHFFLSSPSYSPHIWPSSAQTSIPISSRLRLISSFTWTSIWWESQILQIPNQLPNSHHPNFLLNPVMQNPLLFCFGVLTSIITTQSRLRRYLPDNTEFYSSTSGTQLKDYLLTNSFPVCAS